MHPYPPKPIPTHCPYPKCENDKDFWVHQRSKSPLKSRFKCLRCQRTFSLSQFDFEFRNKRRGLNHLILMHFTGGLSNCQIARIISSSECLVRERLSKMAKQALVLHDLWSGQVPIKEAVAYDGLENFSRSQYEPNHINQAIGSRSLFIYDFNFAPLNRKGRMSDWQKTRNAHIVQSLGRYPPSAVARASGALFERLSLRSKRIGRHLSLLTDEHFQYRRAVEKLKDIDHVTVSSKKPRTFKNILFPVNHADLLVRQHVKAFARETISFSKKPQAMVLKYALFCVWKNYMRPQFTKPHKADPRSNQITPAQSAGIATKPLSFGDFFNDRITESKMKTNNPDWNIFITNRVPYPRQKPSKPSSTPHLSAHN